MKSVVAILASAAVAIAQAVGPLAINDFPAKGAVAGTTYNVTYTAPDQTKPVTILLRNGDPNNLQTVDTLTTTATGGYFLWTVSTELADGDDYAVQIHQGESINWIGPFPITGGSGEPTEEEPEPEPTVSKPTGTGAPHGTGLPGTGVARPTGTGAPRPTKPVPTTDSEDDGDDEPAPFEGAGSKAYPAVAAFAALFGAVALLA